MKFCVGLKIFSYLPAIIETAPQSFFFLFTFWLSEIRKEEMNLSARYLQFCTVIRWQFSSSLVLQKLQPGIHLYAPAWWNRKHPTPWKTIPKKERKYHIKGATTGYVKRKMNYGLYNPASDYMKITEVILEGTQDNVQKVL